jgi:hypothetical protein
MAYDLVRTKSIKATASLANNQFSFVKLDVNGQLVLASAGGSCVGVLQDKPGAGDPGAVCFPGDITKVLCGAAIPAGSAVASDGSGRAVVGTSGASALGYALTASTALGQIIDIVYKP